MNRWLMNLILLVWGAALGLVVFALKGLLHIEPGTKEAAILYTVVVGGGIILGTRFVGRMKKRPPSGS